MTETLRPLLAEDGAALQALIEADPDYVLRVSGRPPGRDEAQDLLADRPPHVSEDRKVVLGAFRDDALVAVIDVVRGWPDPETAYVGLLQVRAGSKGQGVGRHAHALLLDWLARWPEVTRLRAAIVETNAAEAEPFWAALGYTPSGPPRPYRQGAVSTTVTIWTRPLRDG